VEIGVLSGSTFMVDSWLWRPMVALSMKYVFFVAHIGLYVRVEKLRSLSVTFDHRCIVKCLR